MKNFKKKIAVIVGKNIRKHRESLKFSQEGFADYVNLDRANYGAIERGERNISLYTVARIAVGLKVEVGELFPSIRELIHLLKTR
jgi:transcriptional regulator with XRE-family HTH domain